MRVRMRHQYSTCIHKSGFSFLADQVAGAAHNDNRLKQPSSWEDSHVGLECEMRSAKSSEIGIELTPLSGR